MPRISTSSASTAFRAMQQRSQAQASSVLSKPLIVTFKSSSSLSSAATASASPLSSLSSLSFSLPSPPSSSSSYSSCSTLFGASLLTRPSTILSPTTSLTPLHPLGSLRFVAYGTEYQPSQRKRKRKHGFLARLRAKRGSDGPGLLRRRRRLGRRFLSH